MGTSEELKNEHVVVIQNTPVGAPTPLSIYLTGILENLKNPEKVTVIVASSRSIPIKLSGRLRCVLQINTRLYSIIDNLKFSWKSFRALSSLNRLAPVRLIHCIYPNSSLLGAVLFKLIVQRRVEIIYDVRSPWIEMIFARGHINKSWKYLIKGILRLQERIMLQFVDKCIFITDGLRKYYLTLGYDRSTTLVIPTGVDTTLFDRKVPARNDLGFESESIVLGYVGTLCRSRRMDRFLELFAGAHAIEPRLRLFILGEGNDKAHLQRVVSNLRIEEVVRFHEPVAHDAVIGYMRAFNYGVCHLPDSLVYRNSFPLKVLEYLSAGVPVLASDIEAHREIALKVGGVSLYRDVLQFKQVSLPPVSELIPYDWKNIVAQYEAIYWNT